MKHERVQCEMLHFPGFVCYLHPQVLHFPGFLCSRHPKVLNLQDFCAIARIWCSVHLCALLNRNAADSRDVQSWDVSGTYRGCVEPALLKNQGRWRTLPSFYSMFCCSPSLPLFLHSVPSLHPPSPQHPSLSLEEEGNDHHSQEKVQQKDFFFPRPLY